MNSAIGKNISRERKRQNITQTIMAEKLETTQATVSRWESGEVEISAETIVKIADILNVPISQLYKGANAALKAV